MHNPPPAHTRTPGRRAAARTEGPRGASHAGRQLRALVVLALAACSACGAMGGWPSASAPPALQGARILALPGAPGRSWRGSGSAGVRRLRGGCDEGSEEAQKEESAEKTPDERLWDSAREGILDDVNKAVAAGADVNSRDADDMTALHHASAWGRTECCARLADAGADLAASACDGSTPLHLAAYYGHEDACRALLGKGAAVGARDKDGSQPLHNAAYKGQLAVCVLLLEHGAEIDSRQDANSLSALHLAAESGHQTTVAGLLLAGADACALSEDGKSPVDLAAAASHADVLLELLPFVARGGDDGADGAKDKKLDAGSFRAMARAATACLQGVRRKRRETFTKLPSVVTWHSRGGVIAKAAQGGQGAGALRAPAQATAKPAAPAPTWDEIVPSPFWGKVGELLGVKAEVQARGVCRPTVRKAKRWTGTSALIVETAIASAAIACGWGVMWVLEHADGEVMDRVLFRHIPPGWVEAVADWPDWGKASGWLQRRLGAAGFPVGGTRPVDTE